MTDLSPEAQELLRKARTAFSPSDGRLQAVRSALKAQASASLNAPTSSISPAGDLGSRALGAAGWSTGHTVLAAVAIGAIGAGALAGWPLASRPSATGAATTEHPAQPAVALTAPRPSENAAPSTAPAPNPLPPQQEPLDVAVPSDGVPGSVVSPRDGTGAPSTGRGGSRVRAKAPVATPEPADSLAEEVQMVREARLALDRGNAAQALRLLDAHETRFQRGTLQEERLATRVQALCALGQVDRARVVAQELERTAPRSPHLARVRASCIAGSLNR